MKILSLLMCLCLLFSCGKKKVVDTSPNAVSIRDTIYLSKEVGIDSSCLLQISFLQNVIRSKDSALFEANFKIARIWYYDSLCLRNARLDKYLKGWIRRALEK